MVCALNKYNKRKLENQWGVRSQEEEQIVALTAQVQQLLKDKNLKLTRSVESKLRQGTINKKKELTKTVNKGRQKEKGKKKSSDNKWAWKKVPPKQGESRTKTVGLKTYNWCKDHMAWVCHDPAECDLRKKREAERQKENKTSEQRFQTALTAIYDTLKEDE